MNFPVVFAIFSLVFVWLYKRWQERHTIRLALKVPSSKLQVLLGFGKILTSKSIITECVKIAQNYGKNALVYIGPYPFVVTSDPVAFADILSSKLCLDKATIPYRGMSKAIGTGLFTLDAKEWKHERRMLNNSFNNRNLLTYLPIFNKRVSGMFVDLDRDIENGKNTPLMLFFREFTLNIAFATTLGRDLDYTQHNVHVYTKSVARASSYVSHLAFNCFYFIGFIRKLAELTILRDSVEIIRTLESGIIESLRDFTTLRGVDPSYVTGIKAVIDYVDQENIKTGKFGSSAGLIHMLAGAFDTTATSLNLVIILLAIHTEHQERVYAELCEILPDDDAGEVEVVYEHIVQMQYLDRVINEALRVLPIVPHTGRKVMGGSVTLSNGLVLPEGQEILLDFYSLHRSKDIWGPDAHKFNPDHFLPSNVEARHPYSFVPFSKGLRYCIGLRYAELSLKVALARLIKRYKFTTTATMEDLVLENHITSQLVKQPLITTERRKRRNDII